MRNHNNYTVNSRSQPAPILSYVSILLTTVLVVLFVYASPRTAFAGLWAGERYCTIPAGETQCGTTIHFSSPAPNNRVYVDRIHPAYLFMEGGNRGSNYAPWIGVAGRTFYLRSFAGVSHGSLFVQGGYPAGSISASPSTCTIPFGSNICQSNISWSTNRYTKNAAVYIRETGQRFDGRKNATAPAGWINRTGFTFDLYDETYGSRSRRLGSVFVRGIPGAAPPSPTLVLGLESPSVAPGGSTDINWFTQNVDWCYWSGGPWGPHTPVTISPTTWSTGPLHATTEYTMTCGDRFGRTVVESMTVTVGASIASGSISASPQNCRITSGSTCASTITWNTVNSPDTRIYLRHTGQLFAAGASGSQVAPWITNRADGFCFDLFEGVTNGTPQNRLDYVCVTGTQNVGGTSRVNGACGSSRNTCARGTPNDGAIADTSTQYRWRCDGSNGGTNSGTCSAPKSTGGATPSLVVCPETPSLSENGTTQLTAWYRSDGVPVTCTNNGSNATNVTSPAAWAVTSGATRASVNGSGLVSGIRAGTETVQATHNGESANSNVTINAAICTPSSGPPAHAEAHSSSEESGLSANTPWTYSPTNTSDKCQFRCSDGYEWNSSTSMCDPLPSTLVVCVEGVKVIEGDGAVVSRTLPPNESENVQAFYDHLPNCQADLPGANISDRLTETDTPSDMVSLTNGSGFITVTADSALSTAGNDYEEVRVTEDGNSASLYYFVGELTPQ